MASKAGYKLLVRCGADESIRDERVYAPRDLRQLQEEVTANSDNARKMLIGETALYTSSDIGLHVPNIHHVTDLSKGKVAEAV